MDEYELTEGRKLVSSIKQKAELDGHTSQPREADVELRHGCSCSAGIPIAPRSSEARHVRSADRVERVSREARPVIGHLVGRGDNARGAKRGARERCKNPLFEAI